MAGECLVVLAATGPTPFGGVSPCGLAVDGENVYWTDEGNNPIGGDVMRVPLGGGPATTFASAQAEPQCVVLDAQNAYWTAGRNVIKAPLAGGPETAIAWGQNSDGELAVDSTSVYWAVGDFFGLFATTSAGLSGSEEG
ncbi:MAG TPA: hypothetical protein VMB50_21675 [Myxococcales bacterium]|nr:hypothetical protein [Myxococcales bacterium]